MPAPKHPDSWQTLLVLGPTCSGKSAVALELAKTLGTHIISCDSMQVYRGMDIGTAKPSPAELAAVKHHLVDCLDIDQRYDANQFVIQCTDIIASELRAGRKSLIAGGTGLYARALVYDYKMLPADPNVFQQVLNEYKAGGLDALKAEIEAIAPECVDRLATNPRHLMRAVEIHRITGDIPMQLRVPPKELPAKPGFVQVILMPEPKWHREHIKMRTRQMLEAGWMEETQSLINKGLMETPTARQALGYRNIADFLANHGTSTEELLEILFIKTVQYARRQRTWFRHQHPGAHIIPVGPQCTVKTLAAQILKIMHRAQ